MKKENILFGIFGLVVGLAVGFFFANSINKSAAIETPAMASGQPGSGQNPAMPADHPPLGGAPSGNSSIPTAPVPQVMESIEKAKQQPQNYEAQMTAADLYYQIQRFDEAATYYETAAKLKPTETEPVIKAGNARFDAEDYVAAEAWYLKALEKDPKNITVRTDLGLTYYLREPRDVERAIKEYNASLAIDPEHEITLQNLAIAYRDKGDSANMKATAERLRKANPNNPALPRLDAQQ